MKNVTITLPDDVAQKVRVEAAKAGLSVSAWFRRLAERTGLDGSRENASPNRMRERPASDFKDNQEKPVSDPALDAAWDRLLNGPVFDLGFEGKLPGRDERNARR